MANLENLTRENKEFTRVQEKKERGVVQRNFSMVRTILIFFVPVVLLLSAITAAPALFSLILKGINQMAFAACITLIFIIALEIGKYFLAKGAIEDAFDGEYEKDTALFAVKAVSGLLIIIISITLSLWGAPHAAAFWKEKTSPIQLKTVDEISNKYAAMIAAEDAAIIAANKMTWRGAITVKGQGIINEATKNKAFYALQEQEAIKRMDGINTEIKEKYSKNVSIASTFWLGAAGMGEFMYILFIVIVQLYELAVYNKIKNNNRHNYSELTQQMMPITQNSRVQVKGFAPTPINKPSVKTLDIRYNDVNNGFNVHKTQEGLPFIIYKGKRRSADYVKQQIAAYNSKKNAGRDNPKTVAERLHFWEKALKALEA